jgi:hypothetical protein
MAAMKEGGINASEGANALKSGLASLINPSTKAAAMLQSVGINMKELVESNQGDLKATVIDFANALDTLDPLTRARAIEQLFGKFQFARLSTLFDNVTNETGQAARVLELAGSSIEDLSALSEKELGLTADSAMNKFRKSVEDLKLALVPVGETFLQAVTPIVEFLGGILEKFNNLSSGVKRALVILTVAIGAIGPIALMTFGLLANAFANIIKGVMVLRNGYLKLTGQSQILGEQTDYLTMEQIDAAAAAHSLDQSHARLTQTFTAESSAIAKLIAAYQQAASAGAKFAAINPGMMMAPRTPTKRAEGKPLVVGGTGNKDTELALLTPGETVIPADMSKKYGKLINGMIADNIPGYNQGLSYGGKQYNIDIRSQSAIDAVLAKFSKDVSGITSVLDALERQALELGTGFSVTAKSLKQALTEQGVSRNNPKGVSSSGGYVFAHAMEPIESITDSARLMDLSLTENLGALKNHLESASKTAGGYANVMSNFGFVLPQDANKGKMSPEKVAQEFQGSNVSRTMAPVFEEYARSLGMTLDQALSEPSIKQQMMSDIGQFADAIAIEIGKVPDAFLNDPKFYAAVADAEKELTQVMSLTLKNAIANLKTPTTIATFGGDVNRGSTGERTGIPLKAQELRTEFGTAQGIQSYRGQTSRYIQQGEQIGIAIGQSTSQGIIQGAREVLRSQSPSKEMKDVGRDAGKGLILGAQEYIDDAKSVGQQIAGSLTGSTLAQASRSSLYGNGPIDPVQKSIRRNQMKMSEIGPSASMSAKTTEAINAEVAARKTSQQRINSMNSALMGGTFALTSLAGAGSMAGGTLGNISQQVMKFSGLLFGLMSVTQLLTQAKFAELIATRLAAAKQASAFASYGAGLAGRSGLLGSIARVGTGLLRFLGPIGLVTTGLLATVSIIKMANAARERERLAIEGLGDAALLTQGKIKTLGEFFGVAPTQTRLERSGPSLILNKEERSQVDSLRATESFRKDFAKDIESLKTANNKQAEIIFNSLQVQLKGKGFASENIETIIKALQEESGKVDVKIDFKSLDLSTEAGQANLAKISKELGTSFGKQFSEGYSSEIKTGFSGATGEVVTYTKETLSKGLQKSLSTTSKVIAGMFNGLSGQIENGTINAKEFNQSFAAISSTIENMPEPQSMLLLDNILKAMPGDLAKTAIGIKSVSDQLMIAKAAALGLSTITPAMIKQLKAASEPGSDPRAGLAANRIRAKIKSDMKAIQDLMDIVTQSGKTGGTVTATEKGEINPLKAKTDAIVKQTKAYVILRNANIDNATATELSNDAEIAALVIANSKGKKLKDLIGLVNQYKKAIKEQTAAAKANMSEEEQFEANLSRTLAIANLREKLIDIEFAGKIKAENDKLAGQEKALEGINDQIDAITKKDIDPLKAQIDANNFALEGIALKEDAINEQYDTQITALDKIASINQEINNIQKQRMSIADALTRGDISAAAVAVQEARAQQAESAISGQRNALTAGRDSAIAGLGRNALEKENKELQYQISVIENTTLLTLRQQKETIEGKINATQRAITALELEVKTLKDAAVYAGQTRQNIEDQADLFRLAKEAGITYNAELIKQLANAEGIKAAIEALETTVRTIHIIERREEVSNSGSSAGPEVKGDTPPSGDKKNGGNGEDTTTQNSPEAQISLTNKVAQDSLNQGLAAGVPFAQALSGARYAAQAEAQYKAQTAQISLTNKTAQASISKGLAAGVPLAQSLSGARYAAQAAAQYSAKTPVRKSTGGLIPKYMASGGFARGTDTVPAMLTPGEFVVKKFAVDSFGVDNLRDINNGTFNSKSKSSGNTSSSVYNYGINVNVSNSNASTDEIAKAVITQIKNIDNQRIRSQRY